MDPLTAFFLMVAEGFKFGREVISRIPKDVSDEQWRDSMAVIKGILDAFKTWPQGPSAM